MAKKNVDRVETLLQEVFSDPQGMRRLLEVMLEQGMAAEVETHVGAGRHERAEERHGYRNGTKPRSFKTRVGELELSMPQVRGCEPYHPSMFNRWQRSERALLVACAEMYYQGVSTRSVQEVLEVMCQGEISAATVSRVVQELDEKLAEFRGRDLSGMDWVYLMIDARYENVRVNGKVVSQAVLVVVGINSLGRREMLDWRVGDSESETTWGDLFRSLKDRGLKGLKLVTSDAHGGIRAALKRHFQGVSWQRCRVHFKRELARKVSYKAMRELMADATTVFNPQEKRECLRRGEEMAVKWEARSPAAARMLREGLEDCLAVLEEPEVFWPKLMSTNLMESLMKVLKRRTAVVGVFPNRASCDRLVGALLMEQHEKWLGQERPYMNLEQAAR